MTPRIDIDDLLSRWLTEDGPSDVPPRVALAAIETVRSMPATAHRKGRAADHRSWSPTIAVRRLVPARPFGLLAAAAVLILLGAMAMLALSGLRPTPPPSPLPALPQNGLIAASEEGDIILVDPAGAKRVFTTGPDDDMDPVFAPDGRHLVWWRKDAVDGTWTLRVGDPSGAASDAAFPVGSPFEVAWSPDSARLAVAHLVGADAGVALLDAQLNVIEPDLGVVGAQMTWRPDGALLAIRTFGQSTPVSLVSIAPTGGEATVLARPDPTTTNSAAAIDLLDPRWSPDGRWIVSSSSVNERATTPGSDGRRTFVMAADGTGARMLEWSSSSVSEWQAAWSADSRRLLIAATTDGTTQLVQLPIDESPGRLVAELPGTGWWFAWSPDETLIAAARLHEPARLIDVATGAETPQTWSSSHLIDWQPLP